MNSHYPVQLAKKAGLHYINLSDPSRNRGFRRIKAGGSFKYLSAEGRPINDEATLSRIRKLAIPPAYHEVWISKDPLGHLQAVGRDARGRKQYRYHPKWTETQGNFKYNRMIEFAEALPKIRKLTAAHLKLPGLPKLKVLATVVQLLEKTLIRVGNDEYAKGNQSYGLSTLKDNHVKIEKGKVTFAFKGKSHVRHEICLKDARLSQIVKECRDVPGHELFQYLDEHGERHRIHSHDVNEYLKQITGEDYTAKDFRTWGGTVFAAIALRGLEVHHSSAEAKRNLNLAIEAVARKLGNTRSICRKSYIHPTLINSYLNGEVVRSISRRKHPITTQELHLFDEDEKRVLAFLRKKAREA